MQDRWAEYSGGTTMQSKASIGQRSKVILVGGIVLTLCAVLIPAGSHILGKIGHALSKPTDRTICVSGHSVHGTTPMLVGKVMVMVQNTRYVCDKEVLNPNYPGELARWKASK